MITMKRIPRERHEQRAWPLPDDGAPRSPKTLAAIGAAYEER